MKTNLKTRLKNGELCVGSWIQTNSPTTSEILARAGFSWVAADMEHTESDISSIAAIIRAVSRYETLPFVRVPSNDTITIRRCLDMGAAGVIVPLVNDAESAAKAVAASKYPPCGVRGYAYTRANEWGEDFDFYSARANNDTFVFAMIETKEAVENIDGIAATPMLDGVFVGPYDLSGSYGIPGKLTHDVLLTAKQKVISACKKYGKIAGQHIVVPDAAQIQAAAVEGYTFVALGMDTVFISQGARSAMNSFFVSQEK
jgi:2-keto-3-deoxy-L-rhamnonate aldolase RhmA